MTDVSDPAELHGKKLIDPSGAEIGEVREVYLDHETDRPQFALVNTGLFGRKSTFVPLTGASLDGPRVWVDVNKDQVADAPKLDPEAELSAQQEAEIYRHYGVSPTEPSTHDAGADAPPGAETRSPEETAASAPPEQGKAETAPSGGASAGTPAEGGAEAGLPRLRRYVVTEEVDVKVPVQREEIRVEPPEARSGEGGDEPEPRSGEGRDHRTGA